MQPRIEPILALCRAAFKPQMPVLGAVMLALCAGPASSQADTFDPGRVLDGPAVAEAILQRLELDGFGPFDIPVVAKAGMDGSKWVRAMTSHREWPVQVPFSARLGYICGDIDAVKIGDAECWQLLEHSGPTDESR